jgi:hypothetical protein
MASAVHSLTLGYMMFNNYPFNRVRIYDANKMDRPGSNFKAREAIPEFF